MRKLFTILFSLLFLYGRATNYYVSAIGNDGNPGTIGSPWQTISKVNAGSFLPGDSILFRRGDSFYGGLVPTWSGSAGSPIVIGAYGNGAQPIITGFQTVSGWTNLGGNIWESTAAVPNGPALANYVTIGGVNRAMGRFPNPGATISSTQQLGFIQFQSHSGSNQVTTSVLTGTPNWTGADIVIRINAFIFVRDSITAQSGGTITYTAGTGLPYFNGLSYVPVDNAGFFIQNDFRTLDTANEWYYNRGNKKIDVYSLASPAVVQVATIDTLVNIFTQNYITFDHLDFTGFNGYAFTKLRTKYVVIQNCNIYGGYFGTAGLVYGGASSDHNTIQNCYYHDINDCGLSDGYEFLQDTFRFNHVERVGVYAGMGGSADGHYQGSNFQGSQTYVGYNEFDTIGYWGIGFRFSNITIDHNYVHYYCFVKDDGGGIYTQSAATGNVVSWNIVGDGIGALAGTGNSFAVTGGNLRTSAHGIYMDDQASGCLITHNSVYNNSYSNIFLHHNNNVSVLNNTTYSTITSSSQLLIVDNDVSTSPRNGLDVEGNIFVNRDTAGGTLAQQWNMSAILSSRYGDVDSLGIIDYNYYCRPMNDATVATTFMWDSTNGVTRHITNLAGWKLALPAYDSHSHQSPKQATSFSDFFYQTNPTSSPVTVPLSFNYIDMIGLSYNGTVTIAPYSSVILLKNGPIIGYGNHLIRSRRYKTN